MLYLNLPNDLKKQHLKPAAAGSTGQSEPFHDVWKPRKPLLMGSVGSASQGMRASRQPH